MYNLKFTLTTCSKCQATVNRAAFKVYGRVKQYCDEHYQPWKGKKCPTCSKLEHKELMRRIRGSRIEERECVQCSTKFTTKRGHQRFCSVECRKEARKKNRAISG